MDKKKLVGLFFILVAIDQITKTIVTTQMDLFQRIEVIPGFFRLLYIRNTGAAFSILEGQMIFFYAISIVSFIIAYFLFKDAKSKLSYIATTMFVAGAFGNFVDRVIYQSVIDFFSFTFGTWNFAIFNFADIFITCGIGLLFIDHIIQAKKGMNK